MDFVYRLSISEDAVRSVDKDKVLVLAVGDPCDIVAGKLGQPGDYRDLVHGVPRPYYDSLLSVDHVHVIVVVAVPDLFELPIASILALHWSSLPETSF